MRRKGWHVKEEEFLAKNYAELTIKELQKGLYELAHRDRSPDSINAKIKRLKAEGKLEGWKDQETVNRSLVQRRKEV